MEFFEASNAWRYLSPRRCINNDTIRVINTRVAKMVTKINKNGTASYAIANNLAPCPFISSPSTAKKMVFFFVNLRCLLFTKLSDDALTIDYAIVETVNFFCNHFIFVTQFIATVNFNFVFIIILIVVFITVRIISFDIFRCTFFVRLGYKWN